MNEEAVTVLLKTLQCIRSVDRISLDLNMVIELCEAALEVYHERKEWKARAEWLAEILSHREVVKYCAGGCTVSERLSKDTWLRKAARKAKEKGI